MNMETILFGALTASITLVGGLMRAMYKDSERRFNKSDKKQTALLLAVMFLMGRMDPVPQQLIDAVNAAIAD